MRKASPEERKAVRVVSFEVNGRPGVVTGLPNGDPPTEVLMYSAGMLWDPYSLEGAEIVSMGRYE